MRTPVAFITGVAMAYFLDPQAGKGRRHKLRDRALAFARRSGQRAAGKAKYVAGHAEGLGAQVRSAAASSGDPADDTTVKDRILSQAFRDAGVSTGDVSVDVADGIATLRGTLASMELAQVLIERVRTVDGVRAVTPRLTVSDAAGS